MKLVKLQLTALFLSCLIWSSALLPGLSPQEMVPAKQEFSSVSKSHTLVVNASNRAGAGSASYEFRNEGRTRWEKRFPFTLTSAAISSSGSILGAAYSAGIEEVGHIVIVIITPTGEIAHRRLIPQGTSPYIHGLPVPRYGAVAVSSALSRGIVVLAPPTPNGPERWVLHDLRLGREIGEILPHDELRLGEEILRSMAVGGINQLPFFVTQWLHSSSPDKSGSFGSHFIVFDGEFRKIWSRTLPNDLSGLDRRQLTKALELGTIVLGEKGEFFIYNIRARRLERYSVNSATSHVTALGHLEDELPRYLRDKASKSPQPVGSKDIMYLRSIRLEESEGGPELAIDYCMNAEANEIVLACGATGTVYVYTLSGQEKARHRGKLQSLQHGTRYGRVSVDNQGRYLLSMSTGPYAEVLRITSDGSANKERLLGEIGETWIAHGNRSRTWIYLHDRVVLVDEARSHTRFLSKGVDGQWLGAICSVGTGRDDSLVVATSDMIHVFDSNGRPASGLRLRGLPRPTAGLTRVGDWIVGSHGDFVTLSSGTGEVYKARNTRLSDGRNLLPRWGKARNELWLLDPTRLVVHCYEIPE